MKTFLLKVALVCALIVVAFPHDAAVADRATFDSASAHYQSGNFSEAARLLNDTAAGAVAPGFLHNLGNAEFQLGRFGPAILAWERARTLDPWSRNTAANLRFARGKASLDQPEFPWYEVYSSWLPPNVWIWVSSLFFWGGIACLALPGLLKRRRRAWTQIGAAVAISGFILTLPALTGIMTRSRLGVVLAPETPLRLTPTAEGEILGKLPGGELARAELHRGDYVYIRAANDRAGWVKRPEFSRIWAAHSH